MLIFFTTVYYYFVEYLKIVEKAYVNLNGKVSHTLKNLNLFIHLKI